MFSCISRVCNWEASSLLLCWYECYCQKKVYLVTQHAACLKFHSSLLFDLIHSGRIMEYTIFLFHLVVDVNSVPLDVRMTFSHTLPHLIFIYLPHLHNVMWCFLFCHQISKSIWDSEKKDKILRLLIICIHSGKQSVLIRKPYLVLCAN